MLRIMPLTALFMVGLVLSRTGAAEPQVLDLWPGKPPGEKGGIGPEKVQESKPGEKPVKRITNITHPTLEVHRPAKDKDTGAAVIIAPGGGYNILAWDLEGEEVAEWLNSIGVTGIVLKYRVPRRPGSPKDAPPIQALMDAQRAMSLVRSNARKWGIDPQRIGMLGFSAGAHLTAWTATSFDQRAYEPNDAIDQVSRRPDFMVLIYPGGVVARDKDQLAPEIRPSKQTPPAFFAHASNDPVRCENSVVMYLAIKKLGVPAELHIYESGGHGFGLRPSDQPCSTWPQRCREWMNARGFLKPLATAPSKTAGLSCLPCRLSIGLLTSFLKQPQRVLPIRKGQFHCSLQAVGLIDRHDRLVYVNVATPMLGDHGKPQKELFRSDACTATRRGTNCGPR
jgi:acetyl esterase/lipase